MRFIESIHEKLFQLPIGLLEEGPHVRKKHSKLGTRLGTKVWCDYMPNTWKDKKAELTERL